MDQAASHGMRPLYDATFKALSTSLWPSSPLRRYPLISVTKRPLQESKPSTRQSSSKAKRISIQTKAAAQSHTHPKLPAWSILAPSQQHAILATLSANCHSPKLLTQNNYKATVVNQQETAITPPSFVIRTRANQAQHPKRRAVALDCEMVVVNVKDGIREVARVSAIDFLSGKILLDTFVQPTRPIEDFRTPYSGITEEILATAIAEKRALNGWPAVREEVLKHIDADTILVGHSLHHDLKALNIQHLRIVDSVILAKAAVGIGMTAQRQGLKDLCRQWLQIDIRRDGTKGHDSVEDAFAAREVVLWCLRHPKELKRWGKWQKYGTNQRTGAEWRPGAE